MHALGEPQRPMPGVGAQRDRAVRQHRLPLVRISASLCVSWASPKQLGAAPARPLQFAPPLLPRPSDCLESLEAGSAVELSLVAMCLGSFERPPPSVLQGRGGDRCGSAGRPVVIVVVSVDPCTAR